MLRRRSFFGLGAALSAPLVVPYGRIMPVKALPPPPPVVFPPAGPWSAVKHAIIMDDAGRVLATLDVGLNGVSVEGDGVEMRGAAKGLANETGYATRFALTDDLCLAPFHGPIGVDSFDPWTGERLPGGMMVGSGGAGETLKLDFSVALS